jgi:hypothetical protein
VIHDPQEEVMEEEAARPRRGRRLLAALAVAGALAAVPAGVALAGDSSGSGDPGSSGGDATTIQSEGQQRDRGDGPGDREDCPEHRGQGEQDTTEL